MKQPYINFQPPQNIEVREKWKQVLEDEEHIVDRLNTIYEGDQALQEKIQASEQEIRKSEELYNKAKAEIDNTIRESENKMRDYENKLNDLYQARELALKAREDIYKSCTKCNMENEGTTEQKMKKPYRRVNRKSLPADQSNFHDLYESAMHKKSESKNYKIKPNH